MKKLKSVIGASILSADFANLQSQCQNVLNYGADSLHIDIMDGHFVPNLTIGPPIVSSLRKKLPHAHLDCHLMVTHPENYLQALAEANINCFTFHYEANYSNLKDFLIKIKSYNLQTGLSFKPKTAIPQSLSQLITSGLLDKILVMTVEPGFGGQKFMQEMMQKVKTTRQLYQYIDIQVDGGLNYQTTIISAKNGANCIVSGNGIFKQNDRKLAIDNLKQAVNNNLSNWNK